MLDIRDITLRPNHYAEQLTQRGLDPIQVKEVTTHYNEWRKSETALQELNHKRKSIRNPHMGRALKEEINVIETAQQEHKKVLDQLLSHWPNTLHESVPNGQDETNNVLVHQWGKPQSKPLHHADMKIVQESRALAQKTSSGRFATLRGDLARLSRAVGQFMINHNVERGYEEINPPALVTPDALYGTGQLPKFTDDLYQVGVNYLAPTAEVMLTNLVSNEILTEQYRYTALTNCFRSEAGAAGRDTSGLIRMNQFEKCELVSVVRPENAETELEYMTECAEDILKKLELPFRRITLCSGDIGFSAHKTYDLEVWMAGAGTYREISSCSWCGDFQGRRAGIRFRNSDNTKTVAHTLNGSALAVGRTVAAILENYQNGDVVEIPDVLVPLMNNTQIRIM